MIAKKLVDQYAHQSGLKDQLVAEREIVLTYAIDALRKAGALEILAFKGGTCLRKIIFGSAGRFSEDLDFTLSGDDDQDALTRLYVSPQRNPPRRLRFHSVNGIETPDGFWYRSRPATSVDWNSAGRFRLQVSKRERPTLPIVARPMVDQLYFKHLGVRALRRADTGARRGWRRRRSACGLSAASQGTRPLRPAAARTPTSSMESFFRRLVVLKLWQVGTPFQADRFFKELRGADYDWDDLRRLLRPTEHTWSRDNHHRGRGRLPRKALKDLTELELRLTVDASMGSHNAPSLNSFCAEIRERFKGLERHRAHLSQDPRRQPSSRTPRHPHVRSPALHGRDDLPELVRDVLP